MASPLLIFLARSGERRRSAHRRHRRVPVPTEAPSTDAVFLALRRMRMPLLLLIGIFTVSVVGLTLIPGVDGSGRATHLTLFEAFYFISYTATTIGFGEIVPFTTAQRMWVTFSIYLTVIGWAYAIATSLALLQDEAFTEALATRRFQRRVSRIREGFFIVAGYGKAGRRVVAELDAAGRRAVVVDMQRSRIDRLAAESLYANVPGLDADAGVPGVLGLAGLGSPWCRGVLALTGSPDANLAIVMATTLLRPELPALARSENRLVAARMRDFGASAVIDPGDRYGNYLVLAMERPATYRLVIWLIAGEGAPLPELPVGLGDGRWVIAADGSFGDEVALDLRAAGCSVDIVDPRAGDPDITGAVGFVAGSESDTLNLAMAEHARLENPDLFVTARMRSDAHLSLVEALSVDAVYTPHDLVASEVLGRIVTPVLWSFVEHALAQDDAWSQALLARLTPACDGNGKVEGPAREMITLDRRGAPAVTRWLTHTTLTVGELCRDPDDRDLPPGLIVLALRRSGHFHYTPSDETELRPGDQVLVAGHRSALGKLRQVLDYDSVVEYVATGERIPDSWVWRALTGARSRSERQPRPGR